MRYVFPSMCLAMLPGCSTTYSEYQPTLGDMKSVVMQTAASPLFHQEPTDNRATPPGLKSTIVAGADDILSCASKRVDYIPIPPLPAFGYTTYKINGNTATIESRDWPTDSNGHPSAAKVNALLTNIATSVSDSEVVAQGSIGFASANRNRKQYVMDFMKYRIEPLTSSNDLTKPIGWARVGAGMRVIVDITQGDIALNGNLVALAASASLKDVNGFMSVELIGMDSKETTAVMPFTVDLTEGNVQKVIEALAVVKTKLYDTTTVLSPNFIAKVACSRITEKMTTRSR